MSRHRLDTELVRRGLARSRDEARELISGGLVSVPGRIAVKPATQIDPGEAVRVRPLAAQQYVSRGAYKLIGALDSFPSIRVADRDALDAGASTGGFTQVLLERGARRVYAADVGYGQLAWRLRTDPHVVVGERVNVRGLDPNRLPFLPELIVADLSFISLRTVLPALTRCGAPGSDLLLMVKPQFEVGRDLLGAGGVVREPALRQQAVLAVARAGQDLGLTCRGVVASQLPGPSGNVEYFLWFRSPEGGGAGRGQEGQMRSDDDRAGADRETRLAEAVADAIARGPR